MMIGEDIAKKYQKERGKPLPSRNHALLQQRLVCQLISRYDEVFDVLPEFELRLLGKKTVPDISMFPSEPTDWENDVLYSKDPPILTIDILTPTQILGTVTKKIRTNYFKAGVKSAWIVFPDLKYVTVLHPNGNITTYNRGILSDKASGFDVDLDDLFK